jgi:hypothetical protein
VSLEQDSIADDEAFYPASGRGNGSITSDDELVDDNFLLDAVREDELLKKCISSSQPRMVGDLPEDCPSAITPMGHLFWIVALNNVAGCQQFFLKGLVVMDGKIKAQPLRDRRLGNVLVRSPNPMSNRGLDITTMASLANGCALGVISTMANTDASLRESGQGEMSSSYRRRCLGPGEPSMTPHDDIVIANVLLFRVYGATKIWYDYANCFGLTPLVPKEDETGAAGTPVFGLAGFSSDQLDRLDRFFQLLMEKNTQKNPLKCLTTVQHRVPVSVYATKKGVLSFVKDVIGTFSKLIRTLSDDSEITCPRQFVEAIQNHLEKHSKNTLWEVIAQWVYTDLTFLFQFKSTEPFVVELIPGSVESATATASISRLKRGEYVLSNGRPLSNETTPLTAGAADDPMPESLPKQASSIAADPNMAAYPPALVKMGMGSKAGFEYVKAVLGNSRLPFAELYQMHLEYLRGRDDEELGLLHLRKLLDRRTGVLVIYNVGPRSVYLALHFEHALCKIYQVVKMQLPNNNQSTQPSSANNYTHPLLVGKLARDPIALPWGQHCLLLLRL